MPERAQYHRHNQHQNHHQNQHQTHHQNQSQNHYHNQHHNNNRHHNNHHHNNNQQKPERPVIPLDQEIESLKKLVNAGKGQFISPKRIVSLMSANKPSGQIATVEQAFQLLGIARESRIANNYIYNSMISMLGKNKRFKDAIHVLDLMQIDGCEADNYTFASIFDGIGRASDLTKIDQYYITVNFYKVMKNNYVYADIVIYNTLINILGRTEKIHHALRFFEAMKEEGIQPNERTYNILIKIFCKSGRSADALEILEIMREQHIMPNEITYGTLASHFSQTKNFGYFSKIVEKMETEGVKQSLVLSNILLGMCKKANRIEKTLKLLGAANISQPELAFVSLINDLEKARKIETANEILATIRNSGNKPNLVTYNSLLMVFGRAGKFSESIVIVEQMREDGIKPDVITFNALIGTFCGAHKTPEAVEIFKTMLRENVTPNDKTCIPLVGCLLREGQHKLAKEIFHSVSSRTDPAAFHVICERIEKKFPAQMESTIFSSQDNLQEVFQPLPRSSHSYKGTTYVPYRAGSPAM